MARIRIAVTGSNGQVARSLVERAAGTISTSSHRPARARSRRPATIEGAIAAIARRCRWSAPPPTPTWTRRRASPISPTRINADGAGAAGRRRAQRSAFRIIHLSTDYVFDGSKPAPYVEERPDRPAQRLRPLARPRASARSRRRIRITSSCARAWVYSPFGAQFRADHAAARAASASTDRAWWPTRSATRPAAADIADGDPRGRAPASSAGRRRGRYGTFHMAGAGERQLGGLRRGASLRPRPRAAARPREVVRSRRAEYPTPARAAGQLPARLRQDRARHSAIALPDWRSRRSRRASSAILRAKGQAMKGIILAGGTRHAAASDDAGGLASSCCRSTTSR